MSVKFKENSLWPCSIYICH